MDRKVGQDSLDQSLRKAAEEKLPTLYSVQKPW